MNPFDVERAVRDVWAMDVTAADLDPSLPMSEGKPPKRTVKKRQRPLAIRFAEQVLDTEPESGQWYRLDQPVTRSIVSPTTRQWARDHGVVFSIRMDQGTRQTFLWVCKL